MTTCCKCKVGEHKRHFALATFTITFFVMSSTLYLTNLRYGCQMVIASFLERVRLAPQPWRTVAPLRYTEQCYPVLSLDCAPTPSLHPGTIQGKEETKFCHLAILFRYTTLMRDATAGYSPFIQPMVTHKANESTKSIFPTPDELFNETLVKLHLMTRYSAIRPIESPDNSSIRLIVLELASPIL